MVEIDSYLIILCILLSLMMVYIKRNSPLKVYQTLGFVYENELKVVKSYLRILDVEFVSSDIIQGKEIRKYAVTIYYNDRQKFVEVMTNIIAKGSIKIF